MTAAPRRADVVVVGAGPAGSAAALAARLASPGTEVVLVDRATFPRDKVCGDGVAPHALDVLAGLGVPAAAVVGGYRPVRRLRLVAPSGRTVTRTMAREAHVVPRRVLDDRLRTLALAAGAEPLTATVRAVGLGPDGVRLTGPGLDLVARAVVAADGAGSVVRRALRLAPQPDRWLALAIRGYTPAGPPPEDPEQVIVAASPGWPAYAWRFPVGDGTSNVGYGEVLRRGPVTRRHLLDRLAALLPGDAADPGTLRAHHLPLSAARPWQPDGPVLLAGDAASLVNPFTGEGIYYAVHSGVLAGTAAVGRADPGRAYRRALRAALGRHLRHTSVAARALASPATVEQAVRAAARDPAVFDALVDLGLGNGTVTARLLGRATAALGRASLATVGVEPA